MAQQILTIPNKISVNEDTLLKRVRRSRLSLHFSTPRTRRWLLVQWVSAPIEATAEWLDTIARRNNRERNSPTLSRLLDDHLMQAMMRKTI